MARKTRGDMLVGNFEKNMICQQEQLEILMVETLEVIKKIETIRKTKGNKK